MDILEFNFEILLKVLKSNLKRSLRSRIGNFKQTPYLLTFLLLACTLTVFYACKEERNLPIQQRQDNFVQVTSLDAGPIEKQLVWIAKGLAGIADQSTAAKSSIHDFVEANGFYAESNAKLDNELQGSLGFDYDLEVDQWLQANQPGNDYDQSYFFDIDIDDCPGKVSVRIPEADIVDQTKLHVVTTDNVLDPQNNKPGYFITGAGFLDSLIISDNNIDSFYLWIVGIDNDCGEDSAFCGDSICQLELGENYLNCEDCPPPRFKTSQVYSVELASLTFKIDKKNDGGGHPGVHYQESHFQGKYKIKLAFTGVDYVENELYAFRFREFQNVGSQNVVQTSDYIDIDKFKAWGKCKSGKDVIRRHDASKGKSNRGCTFTKTLNMLLTTDYCPNDDALVLVPFEYDHFSKSWNQMTQGIVCTGRAYSHVPGQNNSKLDLSGTPFHEGWRVIERLQTFPAAGSQGPWVPIGTTGSFEATLTLDGELTARLVMNPI
jgi:hypothetical protein